MTVTTRRTWPERLLIVALVGVAVIAFGVAGTLSAGQWALSQGQLLALGEPSVSDQSPAGQLIVVGDTLPTAPDSQTIELAEPEAANFLITGIDNGSCADGRDGVIEDRTNIGSRTDTIMIWRSNPTTDQLAVLSFPRDLYVDFPSGRQARINSAYRPNDPSRLIDTIYLNFGIPVDHYLQVDICAFQKLVDAVGGVEIAFDYPTRDKKAHLDIPEAGCITLDGETALAYVRARHFQQEIPAGSGKWTSDGTSDLGRISRQQDFLRRVIKKIIREGLYDPSVASALIAANRDNIVRDTGLTLQRMLEFSNTLKRLDPATISSYQIQTRAVTLSNGDQVLYPTISGRNMQEILAVFRGEAALADAPDQVSETTTTLAGIAGADEDQPTSPNQPPAPSATLPVVTPTQPQTGVVPTDNDACG
ncbi:MAG: hypothetical protein CSA55_02550 [Ilumatobacter coccineus]|uniref:Cell envelope-related transcriptional attenuator domain-containing protein n=1 Tax=Ilumatobacter coccineus TaxID=467094 RepID=A0A2G6KBF8_9ACTN|nr:MAG: hypothetical protein CSA55_02550 [Ilumatobacter coccineus]